MQRVAAFVLLLGGCIVIPSQPATPPPADPVAQPPPRRVIYYRGSTPAPVATNDDDQAPSSPSPEPQPAPPTTTETDAAVPAPTSSDEPSHRGRGHGHHYDDFVWPPAGTEDPFTIAGTTEWKQYTAAEIQQIAPYEPGRAYKAGARVQQPGSLPHASVYRCWQPAGCTSPNPMPNGPGWENVGWYDERAPRYVRRTPKTSAAPPPPLKPGENPFPSHGKPLTDAEAGAVPKYDRDTEYSYGALVKVGYMTVPHDIVYKCAADSCDRAPPGSQWTAYGWHGSVF